jgi:hypothetical protein
MVGLLVHANNHPPNTTIRPLPAGPRGCPLVRIVREEGFDSRKCEVH